MAESLAAVKKEREALVVKVQTLVKSFGSVMKDSEYWKERAREAERALDSRPTEKNAIRKYRNSMEFKEDVAKEAKVAAEAELSKGVKEAMVRWNESGKYREKVKAAAKVIVDAQVAERLSGTEATCKILKERLRRRCIRPKR